MSQKRWYFAICCFLYVVLVPHHNYGQENVVKGKVLNLNNDVANVLVVNVNSKKSTITDALGLFSIEAKLKDTIRFTAVQYLTKEVIIADTLFLNNFLTVYLIEDVIKLSEVTVTPYNLTGKINLDLDRLDTPVQVTASTLGLPNANIEEMTQGERMLLEADRGKYIRLATIEDQGKLNQILGYAAIAVIINTHKIMNKVSGRTKSLEERVARDENLQIEKEIIEKFSRKTISESFDIPETSLDGFLTYCLLQEDFSEQTKGSTSEVWEYLEMKSLEFKKTEAIEE